MAKHEGLDPADFWSGNFGDVYTKRNASPEILESNRRFFELALLPTATQMPPRRRVLELGANIGLNMRALRLLEPFRMADFTGVDVNRLAIEQLEQHGFLTVHADISKPPQPWGAGYDFVLIKGVLIHIEPEYRPIVYKSLYEAASEFIFIAEYFAAEPRMQTYREHDNRMWLADYGGEFWDKYPDLELVDYGFSWRRDKFVRQDNLTWWCFKKPLVTNE
jgi:pseudaminic acid biosynthesis-associated methylase